MASSAAESFPIVWDKVSDGLPEVTEGGSATVVSVVKVIAGLVTAAVVCNALSVAASAIVGLIVAVAVCAPVDVGADVDADVGADVGADSREDVVLDSNFLAATLEVFTTGFCS